MSHAQPGGQAPDQANSGRQTGAAARRVRYGTYEPQALALAMPARPIGSKFLEYSLWCGWLSWSGSR